MKARIHYTLPDGTEDEAIIEADDMEGLQRAAAEHVKERGAKEPWSEMME